MHETIISNLAEVKWTSKASFSEIGVQTQTFRDQIIATIPKFLSHTKLSSTMTLPCLCGLKPPEQKPHTSSVNKMFRKSTRCLIMMNNRRTNARRSVRSGSLSHPHPSHQTLRQLKKRIGDENAYQYCDGHFCQFFCDNNGSWWNIVGGQWAESKSITSVQNSHVWCAAEVV